MTLLLADGPGMAGRRFLCRSGGGKGPLDNVTARVKLQALEEALDKDRLHINKGEFFRCRAGEMKVEEMTRQ